MTIRIAVIEYDSELIRQKTSDEEVRFALQTRLEETLHAAKQGGGGRVFVQERSGTRREVGGNR